MSDQIRVNNNNVQQPQGPENVENVENQAPNEIAKAKTSKLSFALRIIVGIFTLGISECIRFIVNKVRSSGAHENQVRPQNPDLVPAANPMVDQANSALINNIVHKNITGEFKTALNEVAQEYRENYGNRAVPDDINTLLRQTGSNSRPIVIQLRNAIKESNVEITPDNIKPLFDNIIKEHIQHFAVRAAIAEESDNDEIHMDDRALQELTKEFMNKKPAQQNINSLNDAEQFIAGVPNYKNLIAKHQQMFIASDENINGDKVYPENSIVTKAAQKVINEINANFNGFLKSDQVKDLMALQGPGNSFVNKAIKAEINHFENFNDVTQERLEKAIYDVIDSDLKEYALTSIFKDRLENAGIPLENGRVVKEYISILSNASAELQNEIKQAKNTNELNDVVNKYSNIIDTKINEIVANLNEIENRYLPQVSDEIKPVLKYLIRVKPFDNSHKQNSELFIQQQVEYMKDWRNFESSSTFKGVDTVSNILKTDLSYLEGTHAEGERTNIYKDNVHTTFIADAQRGNYILNGEQIHRNTDTVVNTVKNFFTAPKDIQFITKLANQRLFAAFSTVQHFNEINGTKLLSDGQPFTNEGSELLYCNVAKMFTSDNPSQDCKLEKDVDQTYNLTISEDKKTGTLLFTRKQYLTLMETPKTTFGSVRYDLKVNFTLSAGNDNGVPTVDSVSLSQTFGTK